MEKITFTKWELNEIRKCAIDNEIPYLTLKKAVIAYLRDIEQKRERELSEIKDIYALTAAELWGLRRYIPLGSLYLSDYENRYGIDHKTLSDFFDGYLEDVFYYINEERAENGLEPLDYGDSDFDTYFDRYDTAENLYNYVQGVEWLDGDMCGEAKAKINNKYDEQRNDLFEREEIYMLAETFIYRALQRTAA